MEDDRFEGKASSLNILHNHNALPVLLPQSESSIHIPPWQGTHWPDEPNFLKIM